MLQSFEDDIRRGALQSNEDLAVAALVVSPFVAVMVVLLYRIGWPPMLELVLLTITVHLTATVWNAGWRAGPAMEGPAQHEGEIVE